MLARTRRRLSYANVVSTIALFVVLGGGAYATIDRKIGAADLKRGAVTTKKIKQRAVKAGKLGPASVATPKVADGAITTPKLGESAVTGAKIAGGAVATAKIANNAVGSAQLEPSSVGARELKQGEVQFANLAPGAVSPRLFAHVSASGVLAEQSGVESAARTATGTYEVRFDRSLRGCVAVASVGFGFGPGVIGAGATALASMNADNDPNKVRVTVFRRGWTFNDVENNDFHLIVAC